MLLLSFQEKYFFLLLLLLLLLLLSAKLSCELRLSLSHFKGFFFILSLFSFFFFFSQVGFYIWRGKE